MHKLYDMHGPRGSTAMVAAIVRDLAGGGLDDVVTSLGALAALARRANPHHSEWGTNTSTITRALREGEAQGWWAIDYEKIPGWGARVRIVVRFRVPAWAMAAWNTILGNAGRKRARTLASSPAPPTGGRDPVDVAAPDPPLDRPLSPAAVAKMQRAAQLAARTVNARDG